MVTVKVLEEHLDAFGLMGTGVIKDGGMKIQMDTNATPRKMPSIMPPEGRIGS